MIVPSFLGAQFPNLDVVGAILFCDPIQCCVNQSISFIQIFSLQNRPGYLFVIQLVPQPIRSSHKIVFHVVVQLKTADVGFMGDVTFVKFDHTLCKLLMLEVEISKASGGDQASFQILGPIL